MATIFNALKTGFAMSTYVPVTDKLADDPDLSFTRTRYCVNAQQTLAPGPNIVPDALWNAWSQSTNAPSLRNVIYLA
jgi:hypothetical protein